MEFKRPTEVPKGLERDQHPMTSPGASDTVATGALVRRWIGEANG
jgi:hypothetical protein